MAQKIRIGIDIDHVIRDINRQIVKYYQRDFDESIDIDNVDLTDDVMKNVCDFETTDERERFLYEDYALEIFGHANQTKRTVSRDINKWIQDLQNQEKYDVDVFLFSMKEFNLTIQSTYFFLSKIGSRVRKVFFPKNLDELLSYGDVFITAYPETAKFLKKNEKGVILIKMTFNNGCSKYSDLELDDLSELINEKENIDKIANTLNKNKSCQAKKKKSSFWTSMLSWISSFLQTKKGEQT